MEVLFSLYGELYYQVQQLERKKEFIRNDSYELLSSGITELPHTKNRKEIRMNYHHFTIEERACLRELLLGDGDLIINRRNRTLSRLADAY